tara:strand:- start:40 stop:483 length:444 start_codon:yes stop_codon:yes gene_type:complete
MALSIEKVIHNLHFDRLFLDKISAVEEAQRKNLHGNGIPFHYIAVFKTLLCMNENAMNTRNISTNYEKIFGRHILQSSLSRTLSYLSETLNLCTYVDSQYSPDRRFTWLKLSTAGKKFQKHLIGSTDVDQVHAKEIRNVINIKQGVK